jgi:pimeloyl-ACP methyl ester carboxylesterase
VVFAFLYVVSPGSTPEFRDEHGAVINNSIAKMEYAKIGGVEQFLLIRGKNKNNPVLLVLHGGPGTPELAMFRKFNSELENHFVVVHWDQRGAGKSTNQNLTADSFTIEQFVEDAHEVTTYLKSKLKKEKIFLFGHSWGSLLGIRTIAKYPSDYLAYIGTGQIGDQPKSESLDYQFALDKAKAQNDTVAVHDLTEIGEYSDNNLNRVGRRNWFDTQRFYISKFGGSDVGPDGVVNIFLKPLLFCREYSITDKYNFIKSNGRSPFAKPLFKELIKTILSVNLTDMKELGIPIYFLQGKYDYLTNCSVAREYFDLLNVPKKTFIEFEKSAHFVPFEEPGKFNSILINQILKECPTR